MYNKSYFVYDIKLYLNEKKNILLLLFKLIVSNLWGCSYHGNDVTMQKKEKKNANYDFFFSLLIVR